MATPETTALSIRIHLPPSPIDPGGSHLTLPSSPSSTVADLKAGLVERCGLGAEEGEALGLAKGARRLRDAERLGEVFEEERKVRPVRLLGAVRLEGPIEGRGRFYSADSRCPGKVDR